MAKKSRDTLGEGLRVTTDPKPGEDFDAVDLRAAAAMHLVNPGPRTRLLGVVEGPPYRFSLVEYEVPLSECKVLLSDMDRQRALDAVRLRMNAMWRKGTAL